MRKGRKKFRNINMDIEIKKRGGWEAVIAEMLRHNPFLRKIATAKGK